MTNLLAEFFKEKNFLTETCGTAEEGLIQTSVKDAEFHLIVCDLNLPGMNGVEFIRSLRKKEIMTPTIIITANGSLDMATKALKLGASDYITKPLNFTELDIVSKRALKVRNLELSFQRLQNKLSIRENTKEMIGSSSKMRELKTLISKIAKSSTNVLINGESGSGKELVASSLHDKSERKAKPFVAINCSAIPSELLESELFGHLKGAFTGADSDKKGLFEEADGGTLFLDEIGDMPLTLQAKVLRAVQEKSIKAVGASKYKKIDVRIIAATHKDLKKAVRTKEFREDLYFRLSVIPINVPPLRERKEDIVILCDFFLKKFNLLNDKFIEGFEPASIKKLRNHKWTGNVRELENTIERAVVLSSGPLLTPEDLMLEGFVQVDGATKEIFDNLMPLKDLEKAYIQFILDKTEGRKEEASKILGINRKTLYRKEKEFES
jgi:DNA-binding NtrC family response regulator